MIEILFFLFGIVIFGQMCAIVTRLGRIQDLLEHQCKQLDFISTVLTSAPKPADPPPQSAATIPSFRTL